MEYVDLIATIIDTEKEAQEIVGQARRDALDQELAELSAKLHEEQMKKAQQTVEAFRESEARRVTSVLAVTDKKLSDNIAKLDILFRQNTARWEDLLFRKIVGQDL
jgi:hypothetical protein